MLAGVERGNPHALVADIDEIAVLELHAAHVDVREPDKRNHDADGADGDVEHRDLLDLHEPGVEVPRAGEQHLLLQAAPAAVGDERLRVLKVVVVVN
jgi:hypothetical protein